MTTSRVINEVASVKKTILMALAALSLLLVSELALTHYDNVEVGLIICITGLILLYWWANSDTVQVIRGLILWGISTLVFYLSWEQNGIYNSALFAYPCIILLAYTMGSKMLVIPIFLAIAMQVIILALAHEVNLIEILEENPNSYRIRAVDILVVLILFGSISYVFIHNFKQALKKRAKSIATLQDQLEKVNKLLDYDELTSLAKESVFERELNEILVTRTNNLRVAVFILDFPSLQQLNNTLGRQLGDLTVAQVAGRLNSMMQNGERVYRLSGHSFALLKVSESSKESDLFRERLLQAMSTKFDVHGIEVSLFCLLGVAVAPFDGETVEELQKNAYLALQNVEQSTVNSVCYFEPYMKIKEADKYFYIHAIKGAIEGDQLRLFYQPKIDLNTNKIVGVEALTRWHHPERGVISPGDFISAAEESGQIVDITKWAINQACSDMAQWRKADIEDISVAINVSLVDFRSGALPQIIFKALNTNQISPHLLELEITESVIFDDADHVQEQIHKMNVKGVSFAIDDFGTGYSNLGYLSKFNVETLKIDQSFLKDIATNFHNQHIVKSIIKMSKSLHIENVAEGVEDEETAKWLRENDCSMAQGYHWAKPMAFNELVKFLEKNNSH